MNRESYLNDRLIAIKWIIIVTIGVFIIQNIFKVWFASPVIEELFALSRTHLKSGYIWTLITYGFLHANFLHILVNLLVIFFVGRILEPYIGPKAVLKLYFISTFTGGLLWLLLNNNLFSVLVGASAAGFGLMTFFCLSFPNQMITVLLFFILPITLKPKYVLWGMIAIELFLFIFFELPGKSVVASSAHLGGIIGGLISFQLISRQGIMNKLKSGISIEKPEWMKRKGLWKEDSKFKINLKSKKKMEEEVDRILDKINKEGFSSLSDAEKKILHAAKDSLKK